MLKLEISGEIGVKKHKIGNMECTWKLETEKLDSQKSTLFSACLVTDVRWASYAVHPTGPRLAPNFIFILSNFRSFFFYNNNNIFTSGVALSIWYTRRALRHSSVEIFGT